jgi:23S rRNA (guanine2445-N2)-methyltransferase / 23S rRNA (guanine2069-N7)-methyltransferase
MFANRLRKNRKRLSAWVRREAVEAYRLYDADMPEYAVAVDLYGEFVHVAEYRAPERVDADAAAQRLQEVAAALPEALGVPPERIVFKERSRQRGARQYQRRGREGEMLSVREGAARLLVNLRDYLDTGLFLDHRPLRLRIGAEAAGRDFLNLFCYTGAATVHAALGGARSTTSVDLSNTYLDWLRKNLAHNGLAETRHHLVRADCRQWLQSAGREYDLILLDPPSFSNSSAMQGSFDVQRDHPTLVEAAMAVLRDEGSLYFSSNRRGFRLDPALEERFDCVDISPQTLGPDFQRPRKIHRCWRLCHRPEAAEPAGGK